MEFDVRKVDSSVIAAAIDIAFKFNVTQSTMHIFLHCLNEKVSHLLQPTTNSPGA
ncbi:MAG: hypothetical protein U0586_14410 [Candidatus Brocadiaceae bacterium]